MDELHTARMRLVLAGPGDIDAFGRLFADPATMRFINGGRPATDGEVRARMDDPRRRTWLATTVSGLVGGFSLWWTDPTDVELGYRLLRPFWGQGLATEGAQRLIDLAFDELGAARVWAQTMTVNVASRRVMERCGMHYVRTFFAEWSDVIEGAEHGDVEYELFRPPGPTSGDPSRLKSDQEADDLAVRAAAGRRGGNRPPRRSPTARPRGLR